MIYNYENILVSVVIPTYNASQFIEETIKSVQSQTFNHWEIIVVDDCSKDDTVSKVQKMIDSDNRISLIKLDVNYGGPAGPRNIGISKSIGKYIALLDSDDIWHPKKLEIQMQYMKSSSASFICSMMQDFTCTSGISFKNIDISTISISRINYLRQSLRASIPASSILIEKDIVNKIKFFESISFKAVEDYHCWLRVLDLNIHCVKINEPLLYYRKSEGQISSSKIYMLKKVFMVHRSLKRSLIVSTLLTISHIIGAVLRSIRKTM